MEYSYKVSRSIKGKPKQIEESGAIVGPDAFGMAMRLAQHWATMPDSKGVNLLRADDSGINAGKFFLHLIVKA